MLKKVLFGFGILVGVIAIAIAALFVFFPKDLVRAKIEEQVELATERDLTLGDISVSVFPTIGLSANDVALSNPQGFAGDFLRAKRVVFAVALWPLLTGKIEITEITLDEPNLALAANAAGAVNWAFPTKEEQEPERLDALRIDEFRISNGAFTFAGESGDPLAIADIDAFVRLPGLDQPANYDIAFDFNDQRVSADGAVGLPRALLEKGVTPLTANISGPRIAASLDGQFNAENGALAGRFEGEGESLRDTLAWFGSPLPAGNNFANYSAQADIAARGSTETAPTTLALTNGTFALDRINATGAVTLTFSESGRLRATGALNIPSLNLNPYLPAPTQAAPAGAETGEGGVNVETAWSNAALDLSALRAADANLTLTVGALKFQRMDFANAALALALENGAADARLTRMSLYGGSGTARLTANAAGNRITANADFQNIHAEPLLTDAIGFDSISGRGRLQASLSGAGASQAALMRSLDGTASFAFNDGAYKGIDLALVSRTIQSALSGQARGERATTDFAEMAATFQVNNGNAVTRDLRLLSPYVRLDGQGVIDIGAQTIDMRLAPRAVNTIEGQGGRADVGGLGVPFRISGPWSRVGFSLAIGDAVQNEIQSRIRNALSGFIPGQQEEEPAPAEGQPQQQPQRPRNPLEQLQGLIPGGKN